MYADRINDTQLAATTGALFIIMPNTSQQNVPNENNAYMGSDRSATCLVRHIFITCGRKDMVVHIAATVPMIFTIFNRFSRV
jgi:hypothetical protein